MPQLVVRLGKKLRHSRIGEGSDVILECDVRTNPQLIEMGWKYEGTELITDTSRGIVISELSLVLQNVTRCVHFVVIVVVERVQILNKKTTRDSGSKLNYPLSLKHPLRSFLCLSASFSP